MPAWRTIFLMMVRIHICHRKQGNGCVACVVGLTVLARDAEEDEKNEKND